MSQKIIRPEGMELVEYLNDGYAICNKCGAVKITQKKRKGHVFYTPSRSETFKSLISLSV